MNGTIPSIGTPRDARQALVDVLRYELLGPGAPDEILDESPLSRYLVGMLAPLGTDVAPEEQEDAAGPDEGEDLAGAPELTPPLSQALSPSSMGLSFLVGPNVDRLFATVSWGEYHRIKESEQDEEGGEEGDLATDGGTRRRRRRERWQRLAIEPVSVAIDIRPGGGMQREAVRAGGDIWVEHVARSLGAQGVAVSVFLVNRRSRPEQGRPSADLWMFQPEMSISDPDNSAVFVPRELEPESARTDRDLESNALLYRNRREFAVGHGCAVEWDDASSESAAKLATTMVPQFELRRVDPRALPAASFDMATLGVETGSEEMAGWLNPIPNAYAAWIQDRHAEAALLPGSLKGTADDHLRHCEEALARIRDAIELLKSNEDARSAFAFANRAMLLQRSHSEWAEARRRDPALAAARPELRGEWRPFQLAFILLNLRGIVEPGHPDRATGDLLWFPTGGGKTEAYLGLIAFTLAMRRLRTDDALRTDAGVTVLMRYTLRLLTIQQFQRASTLLCACEILRQEAPERWGERRFSIGLWVGRQSTPNQHAEARIALDRLSKGESQDEANPCQLESCPWCGETLTHKDYEADGDRLRTTVACPRAACEFSHAAESELPVLLVDEEIYRECPSVVIATVDKFAQMPWNGEVASLFGHVDRECRRCGFLTPDSDHPAAHRENGKRVAASDMINPTQQLAPPELIIQDELHLISGPLGTMVGLYETAVDALCTRTISGENVRPKVIASTATVRRAFEQVQALFARDLRVFPPPALEPDDSFFAVETPVSDQAPGRLYLGIMAPGKSMKTALIRVAAGLLSAGAGVRSQSERLADPYLTLIAYFNSLRELGGAVRLMEDDIGSRLRQLDTRGLPKRNRPVYEELTSRVRSDRIPALLRRLTTPHDAPRGANDPLPLDAVLASNMISVGMDVDRLGLMSVLGQPKTTAEYIQATSRVGRQVAGPGLVVTIYNWVRPRDLSHYERFGHYHSTLYRHVEAVSVTPYSTRARDRGLAGAFVSLARLREERLNDEEDADQFDPDDPLVDMVVRTFRNRAERVAGPRVAEEVEEALRARVDQWQNFARSPLQYGARSRYNEDQPPNPDALLRAAEGGRYGHWQAPGSLREVEEASRIYRRETDVGRS